MAENQHISIGRLGEAIVARWLVNRGFHVVALNYRKKWGELDIVAQKDGVLHFVEVKAGRWSLSTWPREGKERYRPEDHTHARKAARMKRALLTYLAENRHDEHTRYTADLAVVLINENTRRARVSMVWDIELG